MIVSLFIGDIELDLFKDENISVNSSVANIEDITKNQTDFTKTFTVPASSQNNILFRHYYDADIDGGFDARIKVDGDIRLDGFPFRKGKFRLSKVAIKQGNPHAYTINFWGNLLSIKDKVGKDELSDLATDKLNNPLLSNFDHSYDSATIKTGLTSSLFGGDLIYNLLVKKQYYYSSDVNDTTITDSLVNIGYGGGSGDNGVLFNDLRPSIRVIKLIEAIEERYDITFSRDFFGLSEFTDIFTWINPSKDLKAGGGIQEVDFDGGSSTNVNHTTNIGSFTVSNTSASNDDFYWFNHLTITPGSGFENTPYVVRSIVDGETHTETIYEDGGIKTHLTVLRVQDAPDNPHTYNVTWEVEASQEFKYTTSLLQRKHQSGAVIAIFTTTSSENTIDSNFNVADQLPKVKIIDFLKGLFNMFKLVVIPQDDGTTYVDTLNNYYLKGNLIDVTKYIDYSSWDVERGKILNEINFLFKEPTTILNTQFEENTRIAYGDEETILKDLDGEVLDGTKLEFTLPFETILFERLNDTNTGDIIDLQYGAIIDDSLEPVNPKMTLFYNVLQKLNGANIGFIDDTSTKISLTSAINTPSHTNTFESPNFSLLFGAEFSTWNGLKINNTLYKNYHENYILTIFNPKKRSYKYKAVLPLTVMLEMGLNDILQIKDMFYRIDNFTTNLTTGKVTLNLVNSFDAVVGEVQIYPQNFLLTSDAQTVSSSVTNSDDLKIVKNDVGDGVGWVTTSIVDGNVFYDVDENTTPKDRFIQIELTSKAALSEDIVYIQQLTGANSLDFSYANNSQYIPILTLRN